MSPEEFSSAVASAIGSVHHLYREVFLLMSQLREQLDTSPDTLAIYAGTFGKPGRDQSRLILRNEYVGLFRPRTEEGAEPEDEEEYVEDEAEEPEDGEVLVKRRRAPVQISATELMLAVRIVLYDPQRGASLEPRVDYAVLGQWSVGNKPWEPNAVFESRYSVLRRIPRALSAPGTPKGTKITTKAVVRPPAGVRKVEGRQLACVLQTDVDSIRLFDLGGPEALDQFVVKIRKTWKQAAASTGV